MKRIGLLLLPLCLSALSSCGEPVDPARGYFASLGDAVEAASSNTSFRCYSDNTRLNAGLTYLDNGKEKTGTIRLDPLSFDLRMDNILDGSIKKTKVSWFGKNNKLTKLVLMGDFSSASSTSFDVAPRLYIDEGNIYVDLSDAGALKLMINTYLSRYLESPFPTKAKLETGLPGSIKYKIPDFEKEPFVAKLGECYDVAKGAFSFSEKDGESSIAFSSTDEKQLGLILDALRGSEGEEVASAYSVVQGKFSLTSFDFKLSYTSIGPTGLDFKAGILFPEDAFEEFKQVGEWTLSGKINFAYGEYAKAKTVDDPSSYTPIELSLHVDA